MPLLPIVHLDTDPQKRGAQLRKLKERPTCGLLLTTKDFVAACSLGNFYDRVDSISNMSSFRVDNMQVAVEVINVDVCMHVALVSMLRDGVCLADDGYGPNPEVTERWHQMMSREAWTPARGVTEVTLVEALEDCLESDDMTLETKLSCARQYLETGTFLDAEDMTYRMGNDRYHIVEAYRATRVVAGDRLAIVELSSSFALQGARVRADVVVWIAPKAYLDVQGIGRQITIWQRQPHLVNFAALRALFTDWSGDDLMIASSLRASSQLTIDDVVLAVLRCFNQSVAALRARISELLLDPDFVEGIKDGSSTRGLRLLGYTKALIDAM